MAAIEQIMFREALSYAVSSRGSDQEGEVSRSQSGSSAKRLATTRPREISTTHPAR